MKGLLGFLFFLVFLNASGQIGFIPNQGQWDDPSDFQMEIPNGRLFVEKSSFVWVHQHESDKVLLHAYRHGEASEGSIRHHAYKQTFVGAKSVRPTGYNAQSTYLNFFYGKRRAGRVPIYNNLIWKGIYPQVDLLMINTDGALKYELHFGAGADLSQVIIAYEGADSLYLADKKLHIVTAIGEIIEDVPVAVQEGSSLDIQYVLSGNQLSFKGTPNRRKAWVLDPNFIFSSFSASTADNFGFTATYDNFGNAIGGGIVFGTGYPVTLGAYQITFKGANVDVGITKFSADGKSVLYATYIGGSGNEQPNSLVCDQQNNLIVFGITSSTNFPVTATGYDTTFNGGPTQLIGSVNYNGGSDIYVVKLDPSGSSLLGGTYMGGTLNDGANLGLKNHYGDESRGEVIVDSTGNVYVASCTGSLDFPVVNAYQDTSGGNFDGVMFKLNPDLSVLNWSTYIGGSQNDALFSLKISTVTGWVYAAGACESSDFYIPPGTHQDALGGIRDGLIIALNATSGQLQTSTFNGEFGKETNYFLDIDDLGYIYVLGESTTGYPVSPNVWHVAFARSFIHRFSLNLTSSNLSTTFGKAGVQAGLSPTAFMVDKCRNVYVSGWGGPISGNTNIAGFPTTTDAYKPTSDGKDFYFMVLDGSWSKLDYATYFGGTSLEHVDGGTSRFDRDGTIYQAICAGCSAPGDPNAFPTFPVDVYGPTNKSNNCNLAVLKIDFDLQEARARIALTPDTICNGDVVSFSNSSSNVDVAYWNYGDGNWIQTNSPNLNYTGVGQFTYMLAVWDTICNTRDTAVLQLTVMDDTIFGDIDVDYDPCGDSLVARFHSIVSNVDSIYWNFGDGTTSADPDVKHIYNEPGEYFVYLKVYNQCGDFDSISEVVNFSLKDDRLSIYYQPITCAVPIDVRFNAMGNKWHEFVWISSAGDTVIGKNVDLTFSSEGHYQVTLMARDTLCNIVKTVTEEFDLIAAVDLTGLIPNVFTPNGDNINDFLIPTRDIYPGNVANFYFKVYNRWGEILFESSTLEFAWDGKFDKEDVPEGVYFWLVDLNDNCGNQTEEKGFVHLIRAK